MSSCRAEWSNTRHQGRDLLAAAFLASAVLMATDKAGPLEGFLTISLAVSFCSSAGLETVLDVLVVLELGFCLTCVFNVAKMWKLSSKRVEN